MCSVCLLTTDLAYALDEMHGLPSQENLRRERERERNVPHCPRQSVLTIKHPLSQSQASGTVVPHPSVGNTCSSSQETWQGRLRSYKGEISHNFLDTQLHHLSLTG